MKAVALLFDAVPGWVYAATILLLSSLLVSSRLDVAAAQVESAKAGKALAGQVAAGAVIAASSVQGARIKEGAMASDQAKDVHELNQAVSNPAARIAGLERGMREQARANYRPDRECLSPPASPASGGDDSRSTGLPGLVGEDSLVIDREGQADIARFVASAYGTGEALKTCRKALARCSAAAD